VPFKPDGIRPILCRDCYDKKKKLRNVNPHEIRFDGFNFGNERGCWKHPRNDTPPSPYWQKPSDPSELSGAMMIVLKTLKTLKEKKEKKGFT
jgi:hypothetical protein